MDDINTLSKLTKCLEVGLFDEPFFCDWSSDVCSSDLTSIYTKVSVVPFRPFDQENFHIFNQGLAKNTFTI